MNYTLLHKSAWNTAQWIVYGTYKSQDDAQAALDAQPDYEKRDAKGDFYHTKIMRHRKPISKMTNWDSGTVKFSDGTVALAH